MFIISPECSNRNGKQISNNKFLFPIQNYSIAGRYLSTAKIQSKYLKLIKRMEWGKIKAYGHVIIPK